MFLIFGTRVYETLIVLVTFVCPHCRTEAQQRVVSAAHRITLFFVPLFAVSTSYFVECGPCGVQTGVTKQQAQHSVEWAHAARNGAAA